MRTRHLHIGLICAFLLLTSCGSRLKNDPLRIGVIDEEYTEQLSFSSSGGAFSSDEHFFTLEEGDLPDGLLLGSDGEISGFPTTLGLFEFVVKLFSIDEGSDEDDVSSDTETFAIFVTEASTNEDCPAPNDEVVTETYICAGAGFLESLAAGDSFDLDITYFVDFAKAADYEINRITFTIAYDDTHFEIDDDELTSQILREAASVLDSAVSFTNADGLLTVTITTDEDALIYSGRLIDVPFIAKINVPADAYEFTTTITSITSKNDEVDLPTEVNIDGTVTVELDS